MPFVLIEKNEQYQVGLWRITEPESYFAEERHYKPVALHSGKRLQQWASRAILSQLDNQFPFDLVLQDGQSKPYLSDSSRKFNISHTQEMAAAVLSRSAEVGIDIEKIDARVHKIASRFLSSEEATLVSSLGENEQTSAITLCWCIKETVFKWWGKGKVDFQKDIKINRIELKDKVLIDVDFVAGESYHLNVHGLCIDEHWLTYVVK